MKSHKSLFETRCLLSYFNDIFCWGSYGRPEKQTTDNLDVQQEVSHDLHTHSRDDHTPMDTNALEANDSGIPG